MATTYILIGGGGVRGSFTAACLGALQDEGNSLARAGVVAGVSVGSIIGAALATNTRIADLLDRLQDTDVVEHHSAMTNMFRTLQMYRGKRKSLFSTRAIEEILQETFGDRPVQVKEYTAVAGDALDLKQVEFTVPQNSSIPLPIVLASCAILGAYPAIQLQQPGKEQRWYIDGGFSNAFPMKKMKQFMQSADARVMSLHAAKPWLGRIPDIKMTKFSVRNTTQLLFRQYWYALTKLDHHQCFKLLNIPVEMVPDGRFAAVFTLKAETWTVYKIVTQSTADYVRPDTPTKIIYFCAPKGEQYAQYETMNLSQRHEERNETMDLTIKYGELAAEEMKMIQSIIEEVTAPVVLKLQTEPLYLSF